MNIAQRLQELLKNTNTSRSKLARALGVHTSTVSNWLDGKDVKAENLAMLCTHFDCSLSYLTGTSDEPKEKAPSRSGGSPKLHSVARLESADITPEMDKNIADYIDFLLSKNKGRGE